MREFVVTHVILTPGACGRGVLSCRKWRIRAESAEIQRIWGRHVLPCLSLLHFRNLPIGVECCDFGSGGGFPGIPLAICRPDLKMFLLDSRRKKCDALEEMVKSLELKNVEVLCERGEEL